MKRLLLMLLLLVSGTYLMAQQSRVSGKVTDANGIRIESIIIN